MRGTMEEHIRGRRAYVEKVRSSFSEHRAAEPQAEASSFSMTKLSFLVALLLFGAFYLWQESGEVWYGYRAEDVADMIGENLYETNLLEAVMIK